jgi:hypothetical protein
MASKQKEQSMSTPVIVILVAVALALMVRQSQDRPFTMKMVALPVALAGWLFAAYVHEAPTVYNDPDLYVLAGLAGGTVGLLGGVRTGVRRVGDHVMVKGSRLYAALFLLLLAARLVFAWGADNAWHSQVVSFCIDHRISGQAPIVAALMLMLVATIAVRIVVVLARVAALGSDVLRDSRIPAFSEERSM